MTPVWLSVCAYDVTAERTAASYLATLPGIERVEIVEHDGFYRVFGYGEGLASPTMAQHDAAFAWLREQWPDHPADFQYDLRFARRFGLADE